MQGKTIRILTMAIATIMLLSIPVAAVLAKMYHETKPTVVPIPRNALETTSYTLHGVYANGTIMVFDYTDINSVPRIAYLHVPSNTLVTIPPPEEGASYGLHGDVVYGNAIVLDYTDPYGIVYIAYVKVPGGDKLNVVSQPKGTLEGTSYILHEIYGNTIVLDYTDTNALPRIAYVVM
jgi:hypothetical protein